MVDCARSQGIINRFVTINYCGHISDYSIVINVETAL